MRRSELVAGVEYEHKPYWATDRTTRERVVVRALDFPFPKGTTKADLLVDGVLCQVTAESQYYPDVLGDRIGVLFQDHYYPVGSVYRWEATGARFIRPWQEVVERRNRLRHLRARPSRRHPQVQPVPAIEPDAWFTLCFNVDRDGDGDAHDAVDVAVTAVDVPCPEGATAVGFVPPGEPLGVVVDILDDDERGPWWVFELGHLVDRHDRRVDYWRVRRDSIARTAAELDVWHGAVDRALTAIGVGFPVRAVGRDEHGDSIGVGAAVWQNSRVLTLTEGQLASLLERLGAVDDVEAAGGDPAPVADLIAEAAMRLLGGLSEVG